METCIPKSYSLAHLLTLARAYSAGTGRKMSWIDTKITGHSRKFFVRLSRDPQAAVNSTSMAKASAWFDANWPAEVAWPQEVPRLTMNGEIA